MTRTILYKFEGEDENLAEFRVGIIEPDGTIARQSPMDGISAVGRVENTPEGGGTVYRFTTHDERELGRFNAAGVVHSHGLFEGGTLGWLDSDGVVVRAGYILGEQEVGRIDGPAQLAGAAALLLLFLPEDDETTRHSQRG